MKEREVKQKNLIIILASGLAIVLVLLVGGFFTDSKYTPTFDKIQTKIPQSVINRISSPNGNIIETVMDNPNSLKVDLIDVTKGDSMGVAYVLHEENSLTHYVNATLPDLKEGYSYEGWLVNPTTKAFISTGVLNLNEDGYYTLTFKTQRDYEGYDKVVITSEKILDDTPETHILEGLSQ